MKEKHAKLNNLLEVTKELVKLNKNKTYTTTDGGGFIQVLDWEMQREFESEEELDNEIKIAEQGIKEFYNI